MRIDDENGISFEEKFVGKNEFINKFEENTNHKLIVTLLFSEKNHNTYYCTCMNCNIDIYFIYKLGSVEVLPEEYRYMSCEDFIIKNIIE